MVTIDRHVSKEDIIQKFADDKAFIEMQIETGLYDSNEILNDIRSYNDKVNGHKRFIGDFWIGIWHPQEFEALETIDMEAAAKKLR